MKKLINSLLWISLLWISLLGITMASELYLYPDRWDFGKNCVIEFDIVVDTMWSQVMWTDLMLDTSMEFVDFVPWDIFDYIIPPQIVENGIISLWAFSDPDNLLEWKWTIWKLYLLSNGIDNDAFVRFYFQWVGNTVDTNLSAKWGIDTLIKVHNGEYTFDGDSCVHEVDNIQVEWWISNIEYDEAIEELVDTLERRGNVENLKSFLKSRGIVLLWIIVWLFLILVLKKNKWKKTY